MPALPSNGAAHPSRATRVAVTGVMLLAAGLGLGLTAGGAREPLAARPTPAAAPVPASRINLNTATAAELELLPRIGPALSARIVEDRDKNGPFETLEALDRVKGIGPRTILRLRPHVSVE